MCFSSSDQRGHRTVSFIKTAFQFYCSFPTFTYVWRIMQKLYIFAFTFFSYVKLNCPWNCFASNLEGPCGCSWTVSGTLVDGLLHSCLGFPTHPVICTAGTSPMGLGIKPASRKHIYIPEELTLLQEDSSQFLCFFKWIINNVIRSETSEASLRWRDAKFNTPIHLKIKMLVTVSQSK